MIETIFGEDRRGNTNLYEPMDQSTLGNYHEKKTNSDTGIDGYLASRSCETTFIQDFLLNYIMRHCADGRQYGLYLLVLKKKDYKS